MWGLHWLPCSYLIQHTTPCLQGVHNGAPTYRADMMTTCNPVRSTRSSYKVNLLVVPHQKYKYTFNTNDWYRPFSFLNNKIDTYVNTNRRD